MPAHDGQDEHLGHVVGVLGDEPGGEVVDARDVGLEPSCHSSSTDTAPSQRNTLRTGPAICTQAASRASTRTRDRRSASSAESVVVRTTAGGVRDGGHTEGSYRTVSSSRAPNTFPFASGPISSTIAVSTRTGTITAARANEPPWPAARAVWIGSTNAAKALPSW